MAYALHYFSLVIFADLFSKLLFSRAIWNLQFQLDKFVGIQRSINLHADVLRQTLLCNDHHGLEVMANRAEALFFWVCQTHELADSRLGEKILSTHCSL